MGLFQLYDILIIQLLIKWINSVEICKLDTAMSSKSDRPKLQRIFNHSLFIINGLEIDTEFYVMINWICARNIKVRTFFCTDKTIRLVGEKNIIEMFKRNKVTKLILNFNSRKIRTFMEHNDVMFEKVTMLCCSLVYNSANIFKIISKCKQLEKLAGLEYNRDLFEKLIRELPFLNRIHFGIRTYTPLIFAYRNNNTELFQQLLDRNIISYLTEKSAVTILIFILQNSIMLNKTIEIISMLFKKANGLGIDLTNDRDLYNRTIIEVAIQYGHGAKIIAFLLSYNIELLNHIDQFGNTLLHQLTIPNVAKYRYTDEEICEIFKFVTSNISDQRLSHHNLDQKFLDKNSFIMHKNNKNETILIYAVMRKYKNLTKLILNNINFSDRYSHIVHVNNQGESALSLSQKINTDIMILIRSYM
jgi:hypothetical protein